MELDVQAIARQTIVFAYFFAAILAAFYALRGEKTASPSLTAPADTQLRISRFWLIVAALLLLLGLNKQFNLLSYLTSLGRSLAAGQGLYESRQVFQVEIIFGVVLATGILFGFSIWAMRNESRIQRLVLACLTFLILLFLVRSVSLHAFDFLLYRSIVGLPINWLFELLAIAAIAILTIMAFRDRKNDRSVPEFIEGSA